jgi:inorganic pyrophosphatase
MNPLKQYKKLQTLNVKAEQCLSREEAQEVIRKADKAQCKLNFAGYCGSIHKR